MTFSPLKTLFLLLIRFYQLCISPMFGPKCRFYPSCSSYAMEAIKVYGAGRGVLMSAKRLCKCHPWHPGGFDPVPPKAESTPTNLSSTACGCKHS